MFPKYYNNNTLSSHLPTQKVATWLVTSPKTKLIWQMSLSKLNDSFWKVRVKWINYRVWPIPNIPQKPWITWWGQISFSRSLSDQEYQLTEHWSAKIVDKVVEEGKNAAYWFLRSCRKTYFCRNLWRKSAKVLEICKNLQDSVQRSLQKPGEKFLQISTDSQRSKTWVNIQKFPQSFGTKNFRHILCYRINSSWLIGLEPPLLRHTIQCDLSLFWTHWFCSPNCQTTYFTCEKSKSLICTYIKSMSKLCNNLS